jgi:hypothetical protein
MLPFTSLESLQDVVVIRNSDGNVAYVGPDRRRQAAPSKRKGPERRRTGNPDKPGKIKIPKP